VARPKDLGPQRLARLLNWWEFLRTSFWFVPSLMMAGALVLIPLTVELEQAFASGGRIPWFIFTGDRADARNVLSTVLGSMMTMASLVFSITMVVLTLAASQFGPRLIRSFMANPQTQFVLGTFVMTIVYCLLSLPTLELKPDQDHLPYLSVTMALGLTVISTGLLVLFLHTLARSIVSETVIDRVGDELDAILSEFEPLESTAGEPAESGDVLPADFEARAAFFGPAKSGYVQAIRLDRLAALAERADALFLLRFRAGHFLVTGGRSIGVYPAHALEPRLQEEIQAAILSGIHRTPTQDPDFSIRHLAEIADRALSSAVNDPYTAVAVLDRLSASLCRLMGLALPDGLVRDARGRVRVAYTARSYNGLIQASFNQIRQYGGDQPIIVLHLIEAIGRIAEYIRLPAQHLALNEQLEVIVAGARERIEEAFDREKIEQRYREVKGLLDRLNPSPRRAGSESCS
jgi:uncharacterized membrane protein